MRPMAVGEALSRALGDLRREPGAMIGAPLLAGILCLLSCGLLIAPLQVGLVMMMLKGARGEELSGFDIFGGLKRFLPAVGVALVIGLPCALAFAGGVVVMGGAKEFGADSQLPAQLALVLFGVQAALLGWLGMFAFCYVADGAGALEALRESVWQVKRRPGAALGLVVASVVLAMVGQATALVSLITTPLVLSMKAHAYLSVTESSRREFR